MAAVDVSQLLADALQQDRDLAAALEHHQRESDRLTRLILINQGRVSALREVAAAIEAAGVTPPDVP